MSLVQGLATARAADAMCSATSTTSNQHWTQVSCQPTRGSRSVGKRERRYLDMEGAQNQVISQFTTGPL